MAERKRSGCLTWLAVLVGFVFLVGIISYFTLHSPLPKGVKGPEAEALADKMLKTVNKTAWDTTNVLYWTFPGGHNYLWDKERNFVEVKWGDNKVLLNTKLVDGKAYKSGKELEGEEAKKMIYTAWGYFCNDSFWLNAPVKIKDEGTERSIVKLEDGSDGLLVTYVSGGVTPGDSYLWILNENGLPQGYKMWVSIVPIGGLEFGWDKWISLSTGAKVSTTHPNIAKDLTLTNIKGFRDWVSAGVKNDPFIAIGE